MNRDATSDSNSRSPWGELEENNKGGSKSMESDVLGEFPSLPMLIGYASLSAKVFCPAGASFVGRVKVGDGGAGGGDDCGGEGEKKESRSTGVGCFCYVREPHQLLRLSRKCGSAEASSLTQSR